MVGQKRRVSLLPTLSNLGTGQSPSCLGFLGTLRKSPRPTENPENPPSSPDSFPVAILAQE